MTSLAGAFAAALQDDPAPARRSEIVLRWFLILFAFALLIAAYRVGRAAGLDSYIGPHSGGQFLNGVCVVATKWLTGLGNYVCLSEVSAVMTKLGLAPAGPTWPGFLADRGFLDESLRTLFSQPHWVVPTTTSGPPYNSVMGIGWGMDNGYADFINLSFHIFGTNIEALYRGYWLVCAVSYLLFAVAFRRSAVPLVLLTAAALVQYVAFSSDLFWSAGQDWAASEGAHIHGPTGPRFLSSLCILPALHFLCATWESGPLKRREAVLLGLQGLVLCLALQQRATVYWVLAAALLLAALHRIFVSRYTDAVQQKRRSLILAGLLTLVFLCKTLVALTTHPGLSARGYTTSHTLWGSIFYAMQFHPDWKSRYRDEFGQSEGDGVADFAWKRYVANHPKEQGKEVTQAFIEKMTRNAMIEFARHDPQFVLDVYLFNNPRIIYEAGARVVQSTFAGIQLAVPILLIIFGFIFGVVTSRANFYRLAASVPLVATLLVVSCLPNWATLPTSSSLTDFFILLGIGGAMLMVTSSATGGYLLRSFSKRLN